MTSRISIPFEAPSIDAPCTDALQDFHIRVRQSLDFCGGILYLFGRSSPGSFAPGGVRFEWRGAMQSSQPPIEILLRTHGVSSLAMVLPQHLFASGVIQLAAAFESYIAELLADVHYNNPSLLADHEGQMTAAEILSYESIEQIRQQFIETIISAALASSYPRLVDRLQRTLHVGLHSKRSPVRKADAHHFFEIRNIIVHNEGRASAMYLDRVAPYADDPPKNQLVNKGDAFPADFEWLFAQGRMLLELGRFMDKEITSKWITTASPQGKPAMFWYDFA